MIQSKYIVAISCIGSGIGQSVIKSLRLSRLPMKTIGFGTNPFAYGAYDCDGYDYTKSIYADDYIDHLILKCKEHKIDLIIPGHDDEALLFAQNSEKFQKEGIITIVANETLVALCRDKERMCNELNRIEDVFVETFNKQIVIEKIETGAIQFPLIAKPRGGYASRGIEIISNVEDLKKLKSDYVIQELATPDKDDPNYDFYLDQISKNINPQVSEISIQLVYSPEGKLMGRMASYNKLNNGVPIEIVPLENEMIWSVIDKITPSLIQKGLKGPLNIQGRITNKGLKIFEMNPRFTGITGLRALMGFNEVEACVKEWLEIDKGNNRLKFNYNRFGIRQTADRSIPVERNKEVLRIKQKIEHKDFKNHKIILITGASGYLGQNLITELSENKKFTIWTLGLSKDKTNALLSGKVQQVFDREDLTYGRIPLGNIDIVLHMGFTRPHGTSQQIADSLKFTGELFSIVSAHHIPAVINISSQSVYGLSSDPPWTENTPVAPENPYAQAKYASELMLENAKKTLNTICISSLRLGSLAGGAKGLIEADFLSKFVKKALLGETLQIVGGMQKMERLDIRDAVSAIIKMINSNPENWKPIYNLSSGKIYTLTEIAEKTVEIISKLNNEKRSEIEIHKKNVNMNFGMDSTPFYKEMEWIPVFSIEETIESLVSYFSKSPNSVAMY